MLRFFRINKFYFKQWPNEMLCARLANAFNDRKWTKVNNIIDKVHKHVCGHASFSEVKLLLHAKKLWNHATEDVTKLGTYCQTCRSTSYHQPSRLMSISSLSINTNEILCIDQFYLDIVGLFHFMDIATRFSVALVVERANMDKAVQAIKQPG